MNQDCSKDYDAAVDWFGIYEVKFDGSKLSSGMYFYKIQMGEYTDTKRMVLIK